MILPNLVEAASRFQSIQAAATAAASPLESLSPAVAENAAQTKRRTARLNRAASSQTAKSLVLEADASPKAQASQTDVIRCLSQERVIGTSDLIDINFLEFAIAVSRGVGRVRVPSGFGTGFLIGPGLLMTNHHVIGAPADASASVLQLDYQDNASGEILPTQTFTLDPITLFVTDANLDFTIVAVSEASDRGRSIGDYPWMKLVGEVGKAEVGDPVNIIQHPRGGLKQIAFRENKVIAIPQGQPQFLYYTTDTEPGSSGSPCFNDQWELIALHHSGVAEMSGGNLLKKDHTVWNQGDDPALLNWIGNEGIRVSVLVAFLRSASIDSQARDIIGQALTVRAPNPIELARSAATAPAVAQTQPPVAPPPGRTPAPLSVFTPQVQRSSTSVTWSIPLSVTVAIGQPSAAQGQASGGAARAEPAVDVSATTTQPAAAPATTQPAAAPAATQPAAASAATQLAAASAATQPAAASAATEPAEEGVVVDKDYHKRPGYDPNFLGIHVPLPVLIPAMQADTARVLPEFQHGNDLFELAYYHYSLYMNKKRRTAWFSAANVDGAHRPNIGARQGDRWFTDPRISAAEQLGEEAYEHGIDRGHLTRREDAAWGKNVADALRANNDTFHRTNCSLQAAPFNRGKDRWQGLEQFLFEKHAKKDKQLMVVTTGPILAPNDPVYRNDNMDYSVRCPIQFWKVCVLVREDGTPSATAFVLGQEDIRDLPGFEEAFDVTATQVTIADLETRTGLDFGDIKQHDHFAQGGAPGTLELAAGRAKPIRMGTDIVV